MSTIPIAPVLSLQGDAIARNIRTAWADFLLKGQTPSSKRPYVYASSYRECERRMVLEMTDGDKMPPFEADTLANFRRGSDRERDLLSDLSRIGRHADPPFEVEGQQQRFELKDHKGRVAIVGKVDARLRFDRKTSAPIEAKNWNINTVSRIKTFDDLFLNRWTKAGAYQILCYLYGAGEPLGFILLDRPGIPFLIPVELEKHLDKVELFLQKAEFAMDHKEAGELPDFIDDKDECGYCPFFGGVCNPPLYEEGAAIMTDPDFIQQLERREELKPLAKEFEGLDKGIKTNMRGIEHAIAGSFILDGTWQSSAHFEFPDDATKAKYQVKDPTGKFVLKIVKVA